MKEEFKYKKKKVKQHVEQKLTDAIKAKTGVSDDWIKKHLIILK